jgi:hypothetical protein
VNTERKGERRKIGWKETEQGGKNRWKEMGNEKKNEAKKRESNKKETN